MDPAAEKMQGPSATSSPSSNTSASSQPPTPPAEMATSGRANAAVTTTPNKGPSRLVDFFDTFIPAHIALIEYYSMEKGSQPLSAGPGPVSGKTWNDKAEKTRRTLVKNMLQQLGSGEVLLRKQGGMYMIRCWAPFLENYDEVFMQSLHAYVLKNMLGWSESDASFVARRARGAYRMKISPESFRTAQETTEDEEDEEDPEERRFAELSERCHKISLIERLLWKKVLGTEWARKDVRGMLQAERREFVKKVSGDMHGVTRALQKVLGSDKSLLEIIGVNRNHISSGRDDWKPFEKGNCVLPTRPLSRAVEAGVAEKALRDGLGGNAAVQSIFNFVYENPDNNDVGDQRRRDMGAAVIMQWVLNIFKVSLSDIDTTGITLAQFRSAVDDELLAYIWSVMIRRGHHEEPRAGERSGEDSALQACKGPPVIGMGRARGWIFEFFRAITEAQANKTFDLDEAQIYLTACSIGTKKRARCATANQPKPKRRRSGAVQLQSSQDLI